MAKNSGEDNRSNAISTRQTDNNNQENNGKVK